MKRKNRMLIIQQMDRKLKALEAVRLLSLPDEGWLKSIRHALGMSQRQLGDRLGITAQSVREMEQREKEGGITLNTLKDAGNALEMRLVYGFIPHNGSLEEMIEKRAYALAKSIVHRTSNSMRLEDQENSDDRIKSSIEDMVQELKRDLPGKLWD